MRAYQTLFVLLLFFHLAKGWQEVQKVVASDRGFRDNFGLSVAIDNNFAIVGAPYEGTIDNTLNDGKGAAYIYEKSASGVWEQTKKLEASDGSSHDLFGWSVAISGDYAVVGAYHDDRFMLMPDAYYVGIGSAYVFERDTNGNWNEVQKLTASDRSSSNGMEFGKSVDISDNIIIVGAPLDSIENKKHAGSVYYYQRDNMGVWNETNKVTASDIQEKDFFGKDVAISKFASIISSSSDFIDTNGNGYLENAGAAYVFKRNVDESWREQQKLVALDRTQDDFFGHAVSISDSFVVIGAPYVASNESGLNPINWAGAAYVFKEHELGWQQAQKIVASDREADEWFGADVAIDDNNIVVGAFHEDSDTVGGSTMWSGAAYAFTRAIDGNWKEVSKLEASDKNGYDLFGCAVAISNDDIITGAYYEDEDAEGNNTIMQSGSAYLFSCQPSYDTLVVKVCSSYESPSKKYIWSSSGVYNDTLINNSGCDSVITIDLEIQTAILKEVYLDQDEFYIDRHGNVINSEVEEYIDTIISGSGCDSILKITFKEENDDCMSNVFLPNAFSLSGNGLNNTWEVMSNCDDVEEVNIYERWGQLAYSSKSEFSWNGMSDDGTLFSPGVYMYSVNLRSGKRFVGFITLIR